tara:strand:- start:15902 stop:16195 length:294 start_codon:yes stop_codon:yes gene_type:complete
MSNKSDSHKILHHLDDPNRILIFTVDETIVLIGGFLIGLMLSNLLLTASSVGACILIRVFKKRIGVGAYRAFAYWYLPYSKKAYKVLPPSHIREWLG